MKNVTTTEILHLLIEFAININCSTLLNEVITNFD